MRSESAVVFCGIINPPLRPTRFSKFNNILQQASRETCEESIAEDVHEVVYEKVGGRDIAAVVDGSCQKQGFSSKNGVVTVTSVDTVNNTIFLDCFIKSIDQEVGLIQKRGSIPPFGDG
ncbi:hypothetical protein NPIL_453191 [Nephila pilipes]|uniref:Uncharacterized protein n=1 Tax=Nephila pilipes TaxID=299642 RepID=A0A8X6TV14_NEPPI|nr:hypothetical protein NPIL_453191 [Nephila pilipes]